ncbi:hypothetical protein GCM10007358_14020 [Phocicoccus schoeneichii]|uniref:Uncharacterized protein n=1 Tax=Phocicoccus schoeneichii TaxID=1812261 RepID=A0A6V7R1T2_9BACL|nr:Cthe_2314 family HEPN domain-containing protein [Jeotgalicoccus schoeneichii]GGH54052.1 hypothetical protein GCM10007358_14020 [Jeotgalicoccus schoeneichii]CAD2071038.1 hypothetical protein JEOSCH030_00148 [Jeotgalicoccus schoeneichii]
MGPSLQMLKNKVDEISFHEYFVRIEFGDGRYIFGAIQKDKSKIDLFAINSIYETIVDLNNKIIYSFEKAVECNPSESLNGYDPFRKPIGNELTALYYIENMVFRTSVLWDLLAQMCNVFWQKEKDPHNIFVESFFHDCSQGKNAQQLAKDIYNYFSEEDKVKGDLENWYGNFDYVKEYRNKMTHRNSPNITAISNFDTYLRPPPIFVLKRATEDYLKAISFIKSILIEIENKILEQN